MLEVTWLIIALPLAGFFVQVFFGRRLGDPLAGVVGTAAIGASFAVAVGVYLDLLTVHAPVRTYTQTLWTWIPVDALQVHVRLLVDPLSMTMVLFVTGVSALIHLYSIGYMKGDRDYPKFFLFLNLFVASMLILVLGSNMLVTFAGWEGVGACSYWLVAFWFERDSAASAGKKAFIYNRIGDVGFLIAIFLVFDKLHTVEYSAIFSHLGQLGPGTTTAVCLLLLVGVMGKSAQIPLFPWLADAMEGPTPVSALIHAATMVTAGVYLLCRVSPLLHASADAALVVAIVGAATAFVAATIACAQQDIKKVLAYSTVSQLGYMFLAIGCGAYEAAIFLMVAHAFFKALLFLGAGSVIHGLDEEQDLKRMGDLRRFLPVTFVTFAVGWLAIAARAAAVGVLGQGGHPGERLRGPSRPVGGGPRDGRPHRLLHEPAHRSRLLRQRAVAESTRRRPAALGDAGHPARHRAHRPPPRVPVGDDPASLHPGLLRRCGRIHGHQQLAVLTGPLGRPGVRGQPIQRPSGHVLDLGARHRGQRHRLHRRGRRAPPVDDSVGAAGPRGRIPPLRLVHQRALRRRLRPPVGAPGVVLRRGGRPEGHRRRRQRDGRAGAGSGSDRAPHPDRVRAQLRPRHCPRDGPRPRLHAHPGLVDLMATPFPLLTVLVLVPAGAAVLVALVPDRRVPPWLHEALGLAAAAVTLAVAVTIAVRFKTGDGGFQFTSDHVWAPGLGIRWFLGVDGISLFLVGLTAVLFPLAMLGARARRDRRAFVAWLLVLEAACMGSFVSLDLVLFFLFFEITLVPAYFLIGGWGYARRGYAALKFFIYTFAGSAFLLVGILAIAFIHQSQTGVLSFELPTLMRTHLTGTEGVLLFLAFTAAFAVKAPLFPFHTWSPDAYAEAPTAGSVLLVAVMAKLGTYGIVRFDLNLFPQASRTLAPLLLTMATIAIIYGAVVACAQRDLKRLLAYSSLAQIGFIALGTFALNSQGVAGGVLQMVNHGLIVATLFLLVGWIYERRGSWQLTALRGLQAPAPVLAGVFTVAIMASIGMPGLNGFVGEFLILVGTFVAHRWWAVVASTGVIVAAIYLLWAYQQSFHGRPTEADTRTLDLAWRERLVIAPLVVIIVFLGVFPKPVLDRITPSVNQLIVHVDRVTGTPVPAALDPQLAAARDHRVGALAAGRGAGADGAAGSALAAGRAP